MLTASELTLERYFEPVFAPVSLSVGAGDLLLITGANGAGKTTLIRLLAGLVMPSSGDRQCSAGNIHYLGHQLGVKDDLTVAENLSFAAALAGNDSIEASQDASATVASAIERVGLTDAASQEGRTLSAGQRKRCALARLLLGRADLWLLDEPYSNLDQQGMAMVDGLLSEHIARGGGCVLSTHGSLRPGTLGFQEYHIEPPEHRL